MTRASSRSVRTLWLGMASLALPLMFWACGEAGSGDEGEDDGGSSGCEDDADCKGDRVCDEGRCVDPRIGGDGGASASSGAPVAQTGTPAATTGTSSSPSATSTTGAGGASQSSSSGGEPDGVCADFCAGGPRTPPCDDCLYDTALGGECTDNGVACVVARPGPGDSAGCCRCSDAADGVCNADDLCESHVELMAALVTCVCDVCKYQEPDPDPATTVGTGGGGCSPNTCSGCQTFCDGFGCLTCCYSCSGQTCDQNCDF